MYNMTRRHRRSISVLILIIALSASACTAPRAWDMNKTQTAHEKTQSSELTGADMSIGDAATLLLESDCAAFSKASETNAVGEKTGDDEAVGAFGTEAGADDVNIPGQGTKAVPESETVLEISGIYVSKQYFAFRTVLYAITGSEKEPVKAAEELVKKQITEWNFASEHGILPTDDEVMSYCESMRSDVESDIESRETMLVVVQNMSLNESEYFRVFLPRYEVPFILAEQNVSNYCSENDIDEPDVSDTGIKVKDEQYIHELEDKYSK